LEKVTVDTRIGDVLIEIVSVATQYMAPQLVKLLTNQQMSGLVIDSLSEDVHPVC
jgi:hypothetical protein